MSDIAAFIDTIVDEFVKTRKKPKASFTQFLVSQDVDRRTINEFVDCNLGFITDQISELDLALSGTDEVVKEAYSHFRRPELRDYKLFLNEIIDNLYSYKDSKKIVRKKRRITPDKLVRFVKLYDKPLELNGVTYTSVSPETIIGAKHVFLYNVEKRELAYYTGRSLSVRKTVIIDYDEDNSWIRTVRKPEQFLSEVVSCSKFNVDTISKSLNTKPKTPSGRILSKHILLKVI